MSATPDPRTLLRQMFDAAIASAQPALCVPPHLPGPPRGRTIVIGAGKASAAMAQALERHWPGPLEGLVVTRYGYEQPCERIEIVQAAHPVPDEAGLVASRRIAEKVTGLTADDLVIALISGGGSALLVAPAPGLTLDDKRAVNAALLASGATISEMNCVRRHLSALKGGRLGALCHPARVVTLAISDVPGDDPRDIASGPTVADPTTCADALAIIDRYRMAVPASVRSVLESGDGESVKPGDPRLARSELCMVTTPQLALEAAARVARAAGVAAHILGDSLEGEARDLGKAMAGIARQVAIRGHRSRRPACCCPAARPPSRCAATVAAGATSSSCCPWPSRSTACPACMPSRATPTASTAPRRSRARTSRPTRSRARGPRARTRARAWTRTTRTPSSARWATRWSPGPR